MEPHEKSPQAPSYIEGQEPVMGERKHEMDQVRIFDTTLRDGEQSPGFSMNIEEKILMATQLARLGVDVIEAGFPVASPGDFEAVRRIATEVKGPIITSLARITDKDIDRAGEAVQPAERRRSHRQSRKAHADRYALQGDAARASGDRHCVRNPVQTIDENDHIGCFG